MSNQDQEQTSKEKYDAEMQRIREHQAMGNTEDQIEDEENESLCDEVEKELDKNMGDTKVPTTAFSPAVDKAKSKNKSTIVTRKDFLNMKANKQAAEALKALKGKQTNHLKPEETKAMNLLVAEFDNGKVTDAVLLDLLEEKVDVARQYVEGTVAVKELQTRLLNDIAEATNNLVKARGAGEQVDRMLLKRLKKLEAKPDKQAKVH